MVDNVKPVCPTVIEVVRLLLPMTLALPRPLDLGSHRALASIFIIFVLLIGFYWYNHDWTDSLECGAIKSYIFYY